MCWRSSDTHRYSSLGHRSAFHPAWTTRLFSWPLLNQALAMLGGFLLAVTLVAWRRRTHDRDDEPEWATPAAAARWGRWAVYTAVARWLFYAASRYAWRLGIPLLVNDEFIDQLHAEGGAWAGAWLATFAVIGACSRLGWYSGGASGSRAG